MIKILLNLGVTIFACLFLISCGSSTSPEEKAKIIKEYQDSIAMVSQSNPQELIKETSNSNNTDEFQIIDFPEFLNGLYNTDCKREHWTEEGYSLRLYFNNKEGAVTFQFDRGFGDINKVYFNEFKNLYRLEYEDTRYGGENTFEFEYNKEKKTIILGNDTLIKCE